MILTYLLPLLIVAAMGWMHLEYPLGGDQTVFLMGAESIDRGGVLYVDYWDTKQPGIFLFYWMGGQLFGFVEHGVHALELIVLLLLSAGMVAFLRARLEHQWLAGAAPIATVGMYYALAGNWELTQIEFIVSVPLFLCMVALSGKSPSRYAWFASGIMAGVAAVFKLVLAPIPMAIWALAVAIDRRENEGLPSRLGRTWGPAIAGVAMVLALSLAWFIDRGAMRELLWTWFVYPASVVGEGGNFGRLFSSARWFAAFFVGPLIFMLMMGLSWRGVIKERWVMLTGAWLISALAVILIQTLSWWPYHFLLLIVPVGLLAVRGADGVVTATTRSDDSVPAAAVVATVFALSLLPGIRAAKSKWVEWRNWQISELRTTPVAFRQQISPSFERIWNDTAFLRRTDALPGPIYCFGDPRNVSLAGRKLAIPVNGWSWENYLESQWEDLPDWLRESKPAYICIEEYYGGLIQQRSPKAAEWIGANYEVLDRNEHRTWYRMRGLVDGDDPAS